jgi:hypothetical protein
MRFMLISVGINSEPYEGLPDVKIKEASRSGFVGTAKGNPLVEMP